MKEMIVIDPGHGGEDPGAVGPEGLREADVALFTSHLISRKLQGSSLTRCRDVTLSLSERVRTANRIKPLAFVSVHCNGHHDRKARGVEVYFYPGSSRGKDLATSIYSSLLESINLNGRGTKKGRFHVLRFTAMPAVILELAFITNPEEERLLQSIFWLQKTAMVVASGIKAFQNIE